MEGFRSNSLAGAEVLIALAAGNNARHPEDHSAYSFLSLESEPGILEIPEEKTYHSLDNGFLLGTHYPLAQHQHSSPFGFNFDASTTPFLPIQSNQIQFSPPEPFQFTKATEPKAIPKTKPDPHKRAFPIPALPLKLPPAPYNFQLSAVTTLSKLLEPNTIDRLPSGFLSTLAVLLKEGSQGASGEVRGESNVARALHNYLNPVTLEAGLGSTSTNSFKDKITSKGNKSLKRKEMEEEAALPIRMGGYGFIYDAN